jgi:hypothetical protein
MSNLSEIEKLTIEKLFGMRTGYVMDFGTRTFRALILESTHIDVYTEKYNYGSGSKANRLRAFWDQESNLLVGRLLTDLLEYWRTDRARIEPEMEPRYQECLTIAQRLKQDRGVQDIDAIRPNADDEDFSLLAKSIRESLDKDEPQVAVDRLHTFVVKFTRNLCLKHDIIIDAKMPLHTLFAAYVKYLRREAVLESEMSERILTTSISVFDAFNRVRNNQSFAHDNPILNHRESELVVNNVVNTIKFIESLEDELSKTKQDPPVQ